MSALTTYIQSWRLNYKKFFPAQLAQKSIQDFSLTFIDSKWNWELLQHSPCILVVNTATGCGLHQQLKELQDLYQRYCDRGLVVIAVPTNDFLNQETYEGDALVQHCALHYGVSFPILQNTHVIKETPHPLFVWLNTLQKPQWNYQKYLFNAQGRCIATAGPKSSPFLLETEIQALLTVEDTAKL